jgi:hypothetical protein
MSAASAIKKLEAQLAKLKLQLASKDNKSPKPKTERKRKDKPKSIDSCKSKAELSKFTIAELKDWIKSNSVETKKLYEKHKADLVNLVWKKVKSCSYSECDDESETDSETETDSGSEYDDVDSESDSD